MKGIYTFKGGIDGDNQAAHHQNSSLTTLGDDVAAVSIGVTPVLPVGLDVTDGAAVDAFLRATMQPLVDAGFEIEVQHGPSWGSWKGTA